MNREQILPLQGKQILFGRPNGEKTLGTIMKVNVSKCKVRQDDSRGSVHPIGTIWTVPFELIYTIDANGQPIVAASEPVIQEPVSDFWIRNHKHELIILNRIYSNLSPEHLSCDGEAPMWRIRQQRAELERQLKAIFVLLGRRLDESEAYRCLDKLNEAQTSD